MQPDGVQEQTRSVFGFLVISQDSLENCCLMQRHRYAETRQHLQLCDKNPNVHPVRVLEFWKWGAQPQCTSKYPAEAGLSTVGTVVSRDVSRTTTQSIGGSQGSGLDGSTVLSGAQDKSWSLVNGVPD